MRELTAFENWIVNELEKLEKQNTSLHKRAKEDAFQIRNLEEEVKDIYIGYDVYVV